MDITRDNLLSLIQSGMKRASLGIAGLEKKAGVPKDTVRDFLRGKTQILRADKLQKLLRVIEPEHKIIITGYVGAGTEIFPLDDGDKTDCPPSVAPSDVLAVRIRGDAMYPVFHDGWIIYYSEKRDLHIPHLRGGLQVPYNKSGKKSKTAESADAHDPLAKFFGKPCIVRLNDGRTMLRTLKRGQAAGRYNLISYNTDDIEDAALMWAAKIVFIKTE